MTMTNGEPEIPPGVPPEIPPDEAPLGIPPGTPPEVPEPPTETPQAPPQEVPPVPHESVILPAPATAYLDFPMKQNGHQTARI